MSASTIAVSLLKRRLSRYHMEQEIKDLSNRKQVLSCVELLKGRKVYCSMMGIKLWV